MSAAAVLNTVDNYAQFIAVLVIFILVLGITAFVTKWMANYQKQQNVNCNIELIETTRISNNKYIQIVKIGEKYFAIAVCKDTVTLLCQVPEEELHFTKSEFQMPKFKDLLDKTIKKDSGEHKNQRKS